MSSKKGRPILKGLTGRAVGPTGWICPKCGTVCSPILLTCPRCSIPIINTDGFPLGPKNPGIPDVQGIQVSCDPRLQPEHDFHHEMH